MINLINDVKKITLISRNENLFVAEAGKLPLNIKRLFIIQSDHAQRGKHAHRTLTQWLICAHGICEIICDDGKNRKNFLLDAPLYALLIPPGIWSEQIYHQNETTLLVACDAEYDESDYIRDYNLFLKFRLEIK